MCCDGVEEKRRKLDLDQQFDQDLALTKTKTEHMVERREYLLSSLNR